MTSRPGGPGPPFLLDFVELPAFTRRWKQLGLDEEDDLSSLQLEIMAQPWKGELIQGTHSLRKMRFSPPRSRRGKSGGARILYVYFEEFHVVLLCVVYGKSEVGNISAAVKKQVNAMIDDVREELRRQNREGKQ